MATSSPSSISRRSVLGSLAAACGMVATAPPALAAISGELLPALSDAQGPIAAPVTLLEALRTPVVERVPVAIGYTEDRPWLIAPSRRYVSHSFLWRSVIKGERREHYSITASELGFFAGGQCYVPIACCIDLEDEDTFRPAHCLDWPRITPTYADKGEGRLREGIEIVEYADVDAITTRHEAMRWVADANRETLAETDGELSQAIWWIVLEMGAELTPSSVDPRLCAGVGKVDISLQLACRFAVPTLAEIALFSKGGA